MSSNNEDEKKLAEPVIGDGKPTQAPVPVPVAEPVVKPEPAPAPAAFVSVGDAKLDSQIKSFRDISHVELIHKLEELVTELKLAKCKVTRARQGLSAAATALYGDKVE